MLRHQLLGREWASNRIIGGVCIVLSYVWVIFCDICACGPAEFVECGEGCGDCHHFGVKFVPALEEEASVDKGLVWGRSVVDLLGRL